MATSGTYTMTVDLKGGTCNNLVIGVMDTTTWVSKQWVEFSGITTAWQSFSWTFNAFANGMADMHWAWASQYGGVQSQGTIHIRNLTIASPSTSTSIIAASLDVVGAITSSDAVTAVSFVSTSDRSIKENIQDANLGVIQGVFDQIEVKQYQRTDVPGNRIGFIANDFVAALPEEYGNVTRMVYDSGNPLFALDYSRACCLLWGVCKNQQAALKALTARVAALES